MNQLEQLGQKYGTDKTSSYHNYLEMYDSTFSGIKESVSKVLEIGTKEGASLRMWRDYFPNAIVCGIDNNPEHNFDEERIVTFTMNQNSVSDLELLKSKMVSFDIIIDDGSHYYNDQLISSRNLIGSVKSGGYYIIEDVMIEHKEGLMNELKEYNPQWIPSIPLVKTEKDDNYLLVIKAK